MSKTVGIPEFVDGDAKSMAPTLRAMKQILETLTGQRQDDSKGAPSVYVQATAPVTGRNFIKMGDFWFNTTEKKLYCYTTFWQVVG